MLLFKPEDLKVWATTLSIEELYSARVLAERVLQKDIEDGHRGVHWKERLTTSEFVDAMHISSAIFDEVLGTHGFKVAARFLTENLGL